jgi:oxalate---CoA ligase
MSPTASPVSVRDLVASQPPDQLALLATHSPPVTYGGLVAWMDSIAASLAALGITSADRVAVVLPNGPEMAAVFLGVASCAACAPLNPSYRDSEFDFFLGDLAPKALLIDAASASPAAGVARARHIPVIEIGSLTAPRPAAAAVRAKPDDVALVLHTSGTTSRPKLVPLTHANLCHSARHICESLSLTSQDRCLNVMPLFHIHGLAAALLASLAAGASVVCTPGFDSSLFFSWLDEFHPTWYSAVPTMHQAVLVRAPQQGDVIARTRLRFVRSCSSALPPRVMADLEATLGVPVVEAYGMTEAAHQMASNPLPPRACKPGSVGLPTGPEVRIMDDAGCFLPAGSTGEIVIRGSTLTSGYDHNPAANQAAFHEGWFRTGDQGHFDSEGYLFISGRTKEIINRGGEKISPREIDEVLLDHPAVAQAVAFAMPDQRLGEEVAAAVVLREGASASEPELRDFVASRLVDFKVPRRMFFLAELPKGPTGKLQRIGLAAKLGLDHPEQPVASQPFVAPATPDEIRLADLWRQVLLVERVGLHDNFLDLGGDSLLATRLISRIRDAFGVDLPIRAVFYSPTVAQLLERIPPSARTAAHA